MSPAGKGTPRCAKSDRTAASLAPYLPEKYRMLPFLQGVWYIPAGLDIWNQLLGRYPGRYATMKGMNVPPPSYGPVVWHQEQQPIVQEGSLEERLHAHMVATISGDVRQSYGLFLGLAQDESARARLRDQMLFLGLIDLQELAPSDLFCCARRSMGAKSMNSPASGAGRVRHHLDRRAHALIEQGPGNPDDLLSTRAVADWRGARLESAFSGVLSRVVSGICGEARPDLRGVGARRDEAVCAAGRVLRARRHLQTAGQDQQGTRAAPAA